jgi:hypothetical protein
LIGFGRGVVAGPVVVVVVVVDDGNNEFLFSETVVNTTIIVTRILIPIPRILAKIITICRRSSLNLSVL